MFKDRKKICIEGITYGRLRALGCDLVPTSNVRTLHNIPCYTKYTVYDVCIMFILTLVFVKSSITTHLNCAKNVFSSFFLHSSLPS